MSYVNGMLLSSASFSSVVNAARQFRRFSLPPLWPLPDTFLRLAISSYDCCFITYIILSSCVLSCFAFVFWCLLCLCVRYLYLLHLLLYRLNALLYETLSCICIYISYCRCLVIIIYVLSQHRPYPIHPYVAKHAFLCHTTLRRPISQTVCFSSHSCLLR